MKLPVTIDQINKRIDEAIAANRRTEMFVVAMAAFIFCLGMTTAVLGYWRQNLYLHTTALLLEGLLYWPIKEIKRLRQENLVLQTVPSIVLTLPPKECALELKKMLDYLRRETSGVIRRNR